MTETPLRPITNSGIWIPILAPTCSTMISSDEPQCRGFNQSCIQFPLSIGMLLARDSIVSIPIPSSISLPASLFIRLVIQDLVDNPLVTLLASSLWCCITEWALRYLSVIRSDKSQSWSFPTQQTPSKIPVEHLYSHPVTLRCLVHTRYSSGVSELHDLMVIGTYTWHAENNSNKLDTIICYVHSLGLVHHMILLMMRSHYQVTTLAYG